MVGDADTTELSNTPHGVLSKVNAWKIMLLILYNAQKMEKFPTFNLPKLFEAQLWNGKKISWYLVESYSVNDSII